MTTMNPGLRKLALIAHITLSVGWLGAVVAYLALAIVGLVGDDVDRVRAAYLSMEVIGWFVIVPFSLATVLAGLVESLGTPWGLFRHWWVLLKFLLTMVATAVLLRHMPVVTKMAGFAKEMTWSATDDRALRTQLVIHAAGGLLVLFVTTVLSVYKPWGMTPYGLRQRAGLRSAPQVNPPRTHASKSEAHPRAPTARPRWVTVVGMHAVHAIALALLFLAVHVTRGGAPHP